MRTRPRVHTGQLISIVSSLLLVALMFAMDWYGVVRQPQMHRVGVNGAENAWTALTVLRWGILLSVVVTIGAIAIRASQRRHGTRTETGTAVMVTGAVIAALLIYRVLIDPPDPASVVDVKLGAVLGLLAAVGIAVGGVESFHQERRGRASAPPTSRRAAGLESGPPGR